MVNSAVVALKKNLCLQWSENKIPHQGVHYKFAVLTKDTYARMCVLFLSNVFHVVIVELQICFSSVVFPLLVKCAPFQAHQSTGQVHWKPQTCSWKVLAWFTQLVEFILVSFRPDLCWWNTSGWNPGLLNSGLRLTPGTAKWNQVTVEIPLLFMHLT